VGYGDYPTYQLGPEHIPELMRLLQDEETARAEEPDCYAQVHAWRALAELRATAAIEPLVALLAAQSDDEKHWDDWITEEVPIVLGMIGPAALDPTTARLEARGRQEWPSVYFARALTEIAERYPETRGEVVERLVRVLETAVDNDYGVNGSVIGMLMDLKDVEAWPAIERAFGTDNVDEFIVGDAAEVKWRMGLGPEPPRRAPVGYFKPAHQGTNAKQRFDERMRKKKAEKKKRKAERKRR
jgi:hypothetical protein